MPVSGSANDAAFARGFLCELTNEVPWAAVGFDHLRPTADLGHPLGRITGDLAVIYDAGSAPRPTFLIVEREGSSPGNERNILKWAEAARAGAAIDLRSASGTELCEFERIELWMAFARTEAWNSTDYEKTTAFCAQLAAIINTRTDLYAKQLDVRIWRSECAVEDWGQCGRSFARDLVAMTSARQ